MIRHRCPMCGRFVEGPDQVGWSYCTNEWSRVWPRHDWCRQ